MAGEWLQGLVEAEPRTLLNVRTGEICELWSLKTNIGRGTENAIALDRESTVSRLHARILRLAGAYYVEDLKSKNGTRVNGLLIHELTLLNPGDVIQFGSSMFQFSPPSTANDQSHQPSRAAKATYVGVPSQFVGPAISSRSYSAAYGRF